MRHDFHRAIGRFKLLSTRAASRPFTARFTLAFDPRVFFASYRTS
jgi:hypothetical protein